MANTTTGLNSKRMNTFFNQFIVDTSEFLNNFINLCENKFIDFERKLNRLENNLRIIETKLASIPCEEEVIVKENIEAKPPEVAVKIEEKPPEEVQEIPENSNLIKISESFVYKKYFKMLKFGVPKEGVMGKMSSEGLDPELLNDPDLMIEKCPEDEEVVE